MTSAKPVTAKSCESINRSTSEGISESTDPATHDTQFEDVVIAGHALPIVLRVFTSLTSLPLRVKRAARLPVIMYFHGGGFVAGAIDDVAAMQAARYLTRAIPALVISVGYSLAPAFAFPHAVEDAWRAAQWAADHASAYGGDAARLGVAGHDAGGNLATVLTLIARDRGSPNIQAQALFAPLLDPSLTRLADAERILGVDLDGSECARCYRAYLPNATQRLHPYAAPLESRRLAGLPQALIASGEHDLLHIEAERYAAALIGAGVPARVTRHRETSHHALAAHADALSEAAMFFRNTL